MTNLRWSILSVNIGLPAPVAYGDKTVQTGIFKTPRAGKVHISRTGPAGDGQADLVHHGGEDKAVCVYLQEHYGYWENRLGAPLPPGAFGENLTLEGLTEEAIVIGDTFACGSAIFQLSQPRQPCFKLGIRHGEPKLPAWVQESGRTGFYLRVIQPGEIEAGLNFELMDRPAHGLTVGEANRIYYTRKKDPVEIRRLLAVPELASSWRNTLEARLSSLT